MPNAALFDPTEAANGAKRSFDRRGLQPWHPRSRPHPRSAATSLVRGAHSRRVHGGAWKDQGQLYPTCYDRVLQASLPDFIRILFWDVDPATVDLVRHRDYVMERVMTRGGWDAMRWLRSTYETSSLADFLSTRGERLAPRERAYWSLVASCEVPQEQGGGRPGWT